MSSRAKFSVIYDGIDLKSGQMDVKVLAPALLALGELCERAHKVTNKNDQDVKVLVNSDFKAGSFEIIFDIILPLVVEAQNLFRTSEYKSAKEILEILGFIVGPTGVTATLYGFIKWLQGRRITKREIKGDNINIVTGDNSQIIISRDTYNLANDKKTRKLVAETVRPLAYSGVNSFRTQNGGKECIHITKKDINSYIFDSEEEIIKEEKQEMILQVDTPFLTDSDKKWRFSQIGQKGRIIAPITDEKYLSDVDNGTRVFRKGIRIRALILRKEVLQPNDEIRVEYEIVQVLEHDPERLL